MLPGTRGRGARARLGLTDARGTTVQLPRRPERVVAYSGVAAALWDYGVRPVGIFGPQRREDGAPDTTVGDIDLASVGSAGEGYESLDHEALAALRPDLVVTGMSGDTVMSVIADDAVERVTRIAPLVALDGEQYYETLSWEQAGRYPADLILHDTRAFSLQPDQLATHPTWAALPAVRAGQIGRWSAEARLSAQGFAAVLEDLAATVTAARDDVS